MSLLDKIKCFFNLHKRKGYELDYEQVKKLIPEFNPSRIAFLLCEKCEKNAIHVIQYEYEQMQKNLYENTLKMISEDARRALKNNLKK